MGRGMRVGRLVAGSDVVLRGCGIFWGGMFERGERARVLTDGAGFVGGTGSRRSAPVPASYVTGTEGAMISGIALTAHSQREMSCSQVCVAWSPTFPQPVLHIPFI